MSEIKELKVRESAIKKGTFDEVLDLSRKGREGLVILGAGEPHEGWVKGIVDLWNEEGIFSGTSERAFSGVYLLTSTGGRQDLVMVFDKKAELNIGKMAIWRLRFGGCSWISDFVVNYASHYRVD